MKLEELPAVVITQFQAAQLTMPGGSLMTDLFVVGRSTRDGPDQTVRLRLTPEVLPALAQSLAESVAARQPGQVQRLFDAASLTPVRVDKSGLYGYVLKLSQKNPSQGKELPVEMFVSEDQLSGLADLLNEALARPHPGKATDTPSGSHH